MNLLDAHKLALKLMAEHELNDWKFAFDKSVRRFGLCSYRKKTIFLSRRLVLDNSEEEVIDVCKHEISHAKCWLKHGRKGCGHGPLWKAMCVEVGARPERCYSSDKVNNTAKHKYFLRHKETGKIHGKYFRRPKWANKVHEIWLKNDKSAKGKLELVTNIDVPSNKPVVIEKKFGVGVFVFD
jgi:predicted SprT family Zn-dependent metalloprotease